MQKEFFVKYFTINNWQYKIIFVLFQYEDALYGNVNTERMRLMRKRIMAAMLAAGMLCAAVPTSVYAGSASTNVGNYRLNVECRSNGSTHTINALTGASYPSGSGQVRYSINGQTYTKAVNGSSYQSYWTGTFSTAGSMIYAKTSGYGSTVTAYP